MAATLTPKAITLMTRPQSRGTRWPRRFAQLRLLLPRLPAPYAPVRAGPSTGGTVGSGNACSTA